MEYLDTEVQTDSALRHILNNYCTPLHSLPRVDNHGIQWRGVCNNSLYTYTGGKKLCRGRIIGVEYQELLHGNGPIRLLDSV